LFDQDPENPNKRRNCAWLTYNENRRSNKCHKNGGLNKAGNKPNKAQLKCPASCGVQGCCADDLTFTFENDREKRVDCAWIAKKLVKRQGYCTRKKRVGGHCLKTCDRCLEGLPALPKKKNKKNKN